MHAPVGTYRPNPFGLHETMGNLFEWCRDWFGGYWYKTAPGSGERLVPEEFQTYRIFRGGGFIEDTPYLRSADREFADPKTQGVYIGVRPACMLTPSEYD